MKPRPTGRRAAGGSRGAALREGERAERTNGGQSPRVAVGLEVALQSPPAILAGARFGLLCNQASVDAGFRHAAELLAARFPGRLAALFSPQHGLWSEQQDNMVETPHGKEPALRVPVHSLYSETRAPTPTMLHGLDLLVVDLQDVGTRVYTFVWTLYHCLRACAQARLPVLVLDRPNPLGGVQVEGPLLAPAFQSFVGEAPIPMRHALTIAELARWLNRGIACDLHVVPMQGWRRAMHWSATGRVWVPTSPNLPRVEGVDVYPGQVLLEGTNLSEGRGTTTPFEVCGAPFVDPQAWRHALVAHGLQGVVPRPVRFEPTFQKWQGESCGGLCLHVTDRAAFEPYRTSLCLLAAARALWPQRLLWREPPYEYETQRLPIDILCGSDAARLAIDAGAGPEELRALAAAPASWLQNAFVELLYE
jgi:uncharacterized protein YbbC (DUF1343 family)